MSGVLPEDGAAGRLEILDRAYSRFESVAQPVQSGIAWAYRYHVEAAGLLAPAILTLQEQLGGENQALTLAGVDAFQCATPGGVLAVANLDEYYCIAVKHDQIELAAAAAPVLRQQAQTLLLQVVARQVLGGATAVLARIN
jgi:hypothetical protein